MSDKTAKVGLATDQCCSLVVAKWIILECQIMPQGSSMNQLQHVYKWSKYVSLTMKSEHYTALSSSSNKFIFFFQ